MKKSQNLDKIRTLIVLIENYGQREDQFNHISIFNLNINFKLVLQSIHLYVYYFFISHAYACCFFI